MIGSVICEFLIPTNISWDLFWRLAQLYLGIDTSDSRVGYRVIRQQVPEALGSLRNSSNWEYCLMGIRAAAAQGRYEAIEILNVRFALVLHIWALMH